MIAVIFTLVVLLFTGIIFIALPYIRENDQMKKQKKIWNDFDENSYH